VNITRIVLAFLSLAIPVFADAPTLLTGDQSFDGQPALCRAADGTVWAAWVSYTHPDGDAVMAAACRSGQWSKPERVTAEAAQYLRPAIAETGGRVCILWTKSGDDVSGVWCASRDDGKWSPPSRLSPAGVSSQNPEVAAASDGKFYAVWQEFREGSYDLALAVCANNSWSEGRRFTQDRSDDWDPSIACDAHGHGWVAWSSFRDGDYDVYLREVEEGAKELRLSARGEYDLHPWVAVDASNGVWVAWDSVRIPNHGESGRSTITGANLEDESKEDHGKDQLDAAIHLVCVENGAVMALAGSEEALLAPEGYRQAHAALPKIAFGPDDTLWVAWRVLGHQRDAGEKRGPAKIKGPYWWETCVRSCGKAGWGTLHRMPLSDGTLEEPALVAGPDGAWVAWEMEHRIEGGKNQRGPLRKQLADDEEADDHHADYGHVMGSNGDVYAGRVEADGEGPCWMEVQRRPAPVDGKVAARFPREAARYSAEADGSKYILLWGDFHKHSNISRCSSGNEPGPEDHYKYAHDICQYDFLAMTDHSEHTSDFNWWRIQKLADLYNIPGSFSVLYGYEWSARWPIGHHNVIFPVRPAPILRSNIEGATTTKGLWDSLEKAGVRALTIPHTTADPRMGTDWHDNDDRYQRVSEIFQSCRGSYERDGCPRQHTNATAKGGFYQDGLAKGYRMGIIGSSDHGWGTAYAVAYATENSRQAAFDAVWQRRCYGSTIYGIVLDFRVDGHLMGSEITASRPPLISVFVRGTRPIRRIDIVSNGKVVHSVGSLKEPIGTKEAKMEWRVEEMAEGAAYYYARVIQEDDEMAWASPVWVERE